MKTVVMIHGLPGSGKTTLGDLILEVIGGARINADVVRSSLSRDLKFSNMDRELQAYRLGRMAALALDIPTTIVNNDLTEHEGRYHLGHLNKTVIVDFVCPTQRTRDVFDWSTRTGCAFPVKKFDIWMNTIDASMCRFPDTAKIYEKPTSVMNEVTGWKSDEELKSLDRKSVV